MYSPIRTLKVLKENPSSLLLLLDETVESYHVRSYFDTS